MTIKKEINLRHQILSDMEKQIRTKNKKSPSHFIFTLDSSGSMAGKPWNDLNTAFKKFIMSRK
jgi:uncharacterized protein with von Willebrand factor type A (vWA) domain